MTGRRLHIILSPETDRLLARAIKTGGATRTAVVEAALRETLDRKGEERELEKLGSRMNKLARAMERLADDATAQTESFALFILHYLSVTPPLPESMRAGAEALGRKRFEQFVTEVSARLLGRDRYADALLARIDLVRRGGEEFDNEIADAAVGAPDEGSDADAVNDDRVHARTSTREARP